jgi:hypothetical protein
MHYTYSTLFRLEPPVDLRFPGPSDRRQLGPARLHDSAERHGALKSALESLINRFIDQLSQVSSGDFCMRYHVSSAASAARMVSAIGKPGLASAGEMMAKAGRIVRV